ncbi:MAG: HEPN domain-containing protein, partial [Lachnospiraceae bacterium]|nr:HEPN domain-containing protein [Lachnospiraceae bacterium]
MQHDQLQLSQYRMERAKEDIVTAKVNIDNGLYKGAVNRSYYAIFHAIRAVNVLDGFDASKHSAVIAHFNQFHVHTGDFEKFTYK